MKKLNMTVNDQSSSILESLQTLRSNILYRNDTKTVSFTSTAPYEGKSVLSFYTAVSFASLSRKTLFIDCDMRKSQIRTYFNLDSQSEVLTGLSEYITGQSKEVIYETDDPNLHVIPCGKCPPDPGGILSSDAFARLMEKVQKEYDHIVIDTPPVTVAGDACIVGRNADGVIYVVRDDEIRSRDARHCVELLERSDCRIIGIVSNLVKRMNQGSYYYRNYGDYENS